MFTLSQTSLNHTYTVFVPLPVVNVQLLVAAKAVHAVQEVAVLLMHIRIAPGLSSVAVSVNVTAVLFVASASPLIFIEPVGGLVSAIGFALAVAPVDIFSALSIA